MHKAEGKNKSSSSEAKLRKSKGRRKVKNKRVAECEGDSAKVNASKGRQMFYPEIIIKIYI